MAVIQAAPVEGIFEPGHVRTVYQPIVDLLTGDVNGVEALARWPGLDGITPLDAFEHARCMGRVEELDALCQRAAVHGAAGAGLPHGFRLFVNVEPGASVEALTQPSVGPRIIAEITERALLHDPAELLRSIRRMRALGCGIALDDVGAVPASLALMPFVAPDVIKYDMSLVQANPGREQARIVAAVSAYAERSGATILAEGIETEEHHHRAVALGATLGQGWYFGRPGPLGAYKVPERPVRIISPSTAPPATTPFELLDLRQTRIASKAMLMALSHHIEQQGLGVETPPVVLSAFQDATRMTPATVRRYRLLADRCPLVVALGVGMPGQPVDGVRGTRLPDGDPLGGEWTVVVVGPHYSGALIARDLGDSGPDLDRRFVFALTHDHDTVAAAARMLLERIDPLVG